MLRYRDGDVAAFEMLYGRHRGSLYRYFLRLVRPTAIAEELFQDAWMSVIRSRERYEARAKFTTWLYRVAHSRLVDHYRRTAAGLPLSYADEDMVESMPEEVDREPDSIFDRRRDAQRLLQALNELPEAQREAFLLREEGGLSLEQIAEATGVTAETAKSRLRYAVAKLRRRLAPVREEN